MIRAAFHTALLLLLLGPVALARGGEPDPAWVPVQGEVELEPAAALRSAEDAALRLAWEQFGEYWREVTGPLVPRRRTEAELRSWLQRELPGSRALSRKELQRFESSVGPAFRQELSLALRGEPARELRAAGARHAERLRWTFHRRYLAIGVLWLLLFFAASRVDRATQGYLTKRIRFGALLLALGAAAVLWPHGAVLVG